MKNNYKLFSGSGNEKLAHDIARLLSKPLGKIEIVTFSDSEKRVRILEDVANKTVFVMASLGNPVDSNLVELCLIADALKTNDCGKLVAVIPYYGYARQDKAHREGEGISARVMARLIEAVDFNKVVTVDLHSDLVAGYFHIGVVHLFGAEIFAKSLLSGGHSERNEESRPHGRSRMREGSLDKSGMTDYVVIAPDAGAAKRAQKFAEILDAPLAMMEKKRSLEKLHTIEHHRLIGNVDGKICVLVDDVVTSGSTLVKAAYALKDHGAKKVLACVTHADFVEGTHKVIADSPIDRLYVSDSIHLSPELKFPKLEVITLAPLLANQIKKIV